MELEIGVEDLLNKRKIESDRIEFKAGWNPDDIYHSICAFANDYNNEGGGYIVVGVEEKDGIAVRPIKGIPENMLDKIQKEILGYNNTISPAYFPKVITVEKDDKWMLVIVARTGQQRPYKVPEYVTSKKDKKYSYYIRYLTNSIKANCEQERELISLSDQTPFDCKANHRATIEDISPVLLEDHLRKTGSKLAKQVRERGVEAILEDMQLLEGPPELRYIQNVALMMFCEHPEKFFRYTYVQMTSFPKGSVENPSVSEDFPNITGSVPQMIQATMERFKNLFIREKVIKVPNQMESLRIMNYPYQAVEEAVVNAFYHRDYMSCEPITIEIEPDCINIMNFPGIDRSISEKTIAEGKRFVSRYYRNRRLGEFLKELDLSEGHSSGIPTIQEELRRNGSPRAEFFTDADRRAMRIRIPVHPAFCEDGVEEINNGANFVQYETSFETSLKQVLKQSDYKKLEPVIKKIVQEKTINIQDVIFLTKKSRTTAWRYMQILVRLGVVEATGSTNNIVYKICE
ncbi:MAG: putative DNA binding domain-containing protein [Lachnospiraceae bacterium]|nr:putative DNA binding domain-containing protein [Lachnospiraceae bacterium]